MWSGISSELGLYDFSPRFPFRHVSIRLNHITAGTVRIHPARSLICVFFFTGRDVFGVNQSRPNYMQRKFKQKIGTCETFRFNGLYPVYFKRNNSTIWLDNY